MFLKRWFMGYLLAACVANFVMAQEVANEETKKEETAAASNAETVAATDADKKDATVATTTASEDSKKEDTANKDETEKEEEITYPRGTSYAVLYSDAGNYFRTSNISYTMELYNHISFSDKNRLTILPLFTATTNFKTGDYDADMPVLLTYFTRILNSTETSRTSISFYLNYNRIRNEFSNYYTILRYIKDLGNGYTMDANNYFYMDYLNINQKRVGHRLRFLYYFIKEFSDTVYAYLLNDIMFVSPSRKSQENFPENPKVRQMVSHSVTVGGQFTKKLGWLASFGFDGWFLDGKVNFKDNYSGYLGLVYAPIISWPSAAAATVNVLEE